MTTTPASHDKTARQLFLEAAALDKGRELLQKTLQTLTQEKVNNIEKKKKRDSVPTAKRKKDTEASPKEKSSPPSEP